MLVLTFWCHSDARLRLFCFGYGPQNRAITHEFAERRAVPTNAPRKQYPLQSRPTDRIIIISLLQRRSSDVTILWLTNPRKGRCWRSDIGHTITNYDIRHLFADLCGLSRQDDWRSITRADRLRPKRICLHLHLPPANVILSTFMPSWVHLFLHAIRCILPEISVTRSRSSRSL